MKITRTRLKEIIQEELVAVAEAAGHRGNPNDPWDALFPPSAESDAMRAEKPEEHTPMMPPKESAIAATVGSIINGLRSGKLSAQGAADRLESEVKSKLYKLGLEEGELEEDELEEGAKAGEVYCKHRKQPGGFYRKPPCPAGMDTQKPNRGRKYGDAAPAPKVGFSGFLEE